MDARALLATDRGRGVTGAVVHEQHVHRQPARDRRDAGKHAPDYRLLVTSHDDCETALGSIRFARRLHSRVLRRHERVPASAHRLRHAEQSGDRRGKLEH
jgi:hypothetical protein